MTTAATNKITFKKLLGNGYYVCHRGLFVVIKQVGNKSWTGEVLKRDGLRFVKCYATDHMTDNSCTRQRVAETLIAEMNEEAERPTGFANYLLEMEAAEVKWKQFVNGTC